MAAVTLAQLRARALARADLEASHYATETASIATVNTLLNASADALHDKLVGLFEDRYVAESTFTTSGGLPAPLPAETTPPSEDVALPVDFYRLLGVDLEVSSGTWVALEAYDFRQRNRLSNTTSADGCSVRYRLQGDVVHLLPVPAAGLNARLIYVPARAQLEEEDDPLQGVSGWEEWVVVDTARKLLLREESDTSGVEREMAELNARIQLSASRRDVGRAPRVQDVDEDDYDYLPGRW